MVIMINHANVSPSHRVAKDGNVRMSTRLHAAKNAVADKMDEQKHKHQAEGHKNAAKHNY